MIITGVADLAPERLRRLVYWNAFVPRNGESIKDMLPHDFVGLFEQIAVERGDGSVVIPFPIWREAFMNDAGAISTAKKHGWNILETLTRDPQELIYSLRPG
jgi:hypothetical protein